MKTTITYGNSYKINKGNYEQESPLYSAQTIIEGEDTHISEKAEFERLKAIVDPLLNAHVIVSKQDTSHHRIREKDGKKYPSVTTIIRPDPIDMDKELLDCYARRGSEIERLVGVWLKTRKWETPKADIGSLKYENIPYKKFFEEYGDLFPKDNYQTSVEVFNEQFMYSGEIDWMGKLGGKFTILDFKTGSYKWHQVYAYHHAISTDVEQVAIADLKNAKLHIKDANDPEFWEKFLVLRGQYKQRFGL